ncbi:UDP-glucose dehydrogenase [Microbacterium phage Magritte]|nr:UDP-glucose dehydrogenase [Microbacterium phage Magritte]
MTISTVLVTGGSGFIGSYVVDRLLRDGVKVISFDHVQGQKDLPTGATRFLGDIRDAEAVTEAMAHVDGFIHLAGVLGTQETIQNPKPAILTNITGGLNVLEAAAQYGVPGVNIAVGNHWEQNPYSISKSTVERLCRMYNAYRGTRVSVVRALNAYGPRQSVAEPYGTSKVRKIIPSFVMRALHGDPIQVYGNGGQVMDMVYVGDVADFLVDALYETDGNGPIEQTIEAGTGANTTVFEIAEAVIREVGQGSIEFLPLRPGETPGAVVKADVTTHEFLYPEGFPFRSLENGLAETVAFYRKHQEK